MPVLLGPKKVFDKYILTPGMIQKDIGNTFKLSSAFKKIEEKDLLPKEFDD